MHDTGHADSDLSWLAAVGAGGGPIYLRITEALADARASGLLQPGDRLPPQRDLAQALGVDLTTVTRAFMEARRRNLIEAAPGRGTFVTPGGSDEPVLDLSMNIPPAPLGISLPALIRNGIDGLLKRSSAEALLSYHPGPGSPSERAAGSHWIAGEGERPAVGRMAVGSGAQALLVAAVLTYSREGDVILTDMCTYPGLIALTRALGRRLVGVPGDADGMLPDVLEMQARHCSARLVYLNPTLHNPTTLVMPQTRREEIAATARRLGLTIVEDDPYSKLLPGAPPSLLSLAPDVTIHVVTLAKCVSPFLRTAFLVAPDAEAAERIAAALRGITQMAPPLMTGLAAEWIRNGTAGEIAAAVRAEAMERQRIAAGMLPAGAVTQEASLNVWLPLKDGMDSLDLVRLARRRGLAISPGEEFAVTVSAANAVRISLGAAASRERLSEGLRSLVSILSEDRDRASLAV